VAEEIIADDAEKNENNTDENVMIQIKNLTKVYGSLLAVDKMNLSCYKNEVLALLGHNGAGKTTTISMITGMQAPTSGDVIVKGNSIVDNVDQVRRDLGLCQQHDVLYENLKVREHLEMVCRLKDIPDKDMEEEVNSILELTLMVRHQDKEA